MCIQISKPYKNVPIHKHQKETVCVCVTYTHICSLGGQRRTSRIFLYCFLPALPPWVRVSTGPEAYGLCQWALRIFLSLIPNVGVTVGTHGSAKLFMWTLRTEFRSSCPLSHLPGPTGFLSCRYLETTLPLLPGFILVSWHTSVVCDRV